MWIHFKSKQEASMSITLHCSIAQNEEKLGVLSQAKHRIKHWSSELVLALESYLVFTKGIPKMSGSSL